MAVPGADAIKVIIVDDHAILRSGLKLLIDAQPDMRVVGEASRTADISTLLTGNKANVLLLDIGMPGGSGLQALEQVRNKAPATRVVILTMHEDVALARAALAGGASGFVLKQAAHADLLSAVRAAHRGGLFVDPSVARALVALPPTHEKRATAKLLSDREEQVLQLLAQGYGNQEIATRIRVSVKTVETYRARIGEKLGLRTRAEMTRYALTTGLLTADETLGAA